MRYSAFAKPFLHWLPNLSSANLVTNNKHRSAIAATASSVSLNIHLLPKFTNFQKGISTISVSHGLTRASSSLLMHSMAEIHPPSPRVLDSEMMESLETQLMVLAKDHQRRFNRIWLLLNSTEFHRSMNKSVLIIALTIQCVLSCFDIY
jgi:hypothetical protein